MDAWNSLDPSPARLGQEASRGTPRRLRHDREIALQLLPRVFFYTNPKRPSREQGVLPCKEMTSVVWPLRDYRGLYRSLIEGKYYSCFLYHAANSQRREVLN